MDCPAEERLIREKFQSFPGVRALGFDLDNRELFVSYALGSSEPLREALVGMGMPPDGQGERVPFPFEFPACQEDGATGANDGGSDAAHDHGHDDGHDHAQDDAHGHAANPAAQAEEAKPKGPPKAACCSACCQATPIFEADAGKRSKVSRYHIADMCCPVEEKLIRRKLEGFQGVDSLEFNLLKRDLTVYHDLGSTEGLEGALSSIGMDAVPIPEEERQEGRDHAGSVGWGRLLLAAGIALCSEASHLLGLHPAVAITLAAVAILLAGFSTYKKGFIAIRNLELNMNALMSVAVTGAAILGDYPEAAMVMVLFTLAEELEDRSMARARAAISGLMALAPEKATVEGPDGAWTEVRASQVPVGTRVRVRPGEKLSMDGRIVSGASTVNEAPITGESKPREKSVGDQVFAGTVNESGSFEYLVTEPYENSTLSRILRAVEEAQASRAPIQRFVDRFAAIYTPAVFAAAVLVAIVPPLVLGGGWAEWLYRALITLVVACPCALVISTPVTIVSGLAAATRKGLLVKGGTFLEEGRKLKWLALDKTGTITSGRPVQTGMQLFPGAQDPAGPGLMAASLAGRSDHPVSKAVFAAQGIPPSDLLEVEGFQALPGEGSAGTIQGMGLYLGNPRLLRRVLGDSPESEAFFQEHEGEGRSAVALFTKDRVLGLFAVSDTVREESLDAIRELHRLGIRTMMLTGDNEDTAKQVASEVGVDGYRARLLPEGKLDIVSGLAKDGKVGMVGDGINDAPALAKADIGFAMGAAGTDTAIETASVAIMDDDLRKIPAFVRLSKETFWHLWENIGFSLAVKFVFLLLTFLGFTRMYMAVFADIGVCLIVVANGLRLLKK
jgi:Cd2+/Zn2+-exporting ATPase